LLHAAIGPGYCEPGKDQRKRGRARCGACTGRCVSPSPDCPQGGGDQNQAGQQPGSAVYPDLLPQHPHQPDHRRVQGERQHLSERLHPRPGARQPADELRDEAQQDVERGHAERERGEHQHRVEGRLHQGEAQRRPHERCSGEATAASMPISSAWRGCRALAAAQRLQRAADPEHAAQVSPSAKNSSAKAATITGDCS
jgi:hypothetical protein